MNLVQFSAGDGRKEGDALLPVSQPTAFIPELVDVSHERRQTLTDILKQAFERQAHNTLQIYENVRWGDGFKTLRKLTPCPQIDHESWKHLDLDEFSCAITPRTLGYAFENQHNKYHPGFISAYRMFRQPEAGSLTWHAKQEALSLLLANPEIHQRLMTFRNGLAAANIANVLNAPGDESQYGWFTRRAREFKDVQKLLADAPRFGTPYLDAIVETIADCARGDIFTHFSQGVVFTKGGLEVAKDGRTRSFFELLAPTKLSIDRLAALGLGVGICTLASFAFAYGWKIGPPLYGLSLPGVGLLYTAAREMLQDDPYQIISEALVSAAKRSANLEKFFAAEGRLAEILGWAQHFQGADGAIAGADCFPPGGAFRLEIKEMGNQRNPRMQGYVPNDVSFSAGELVLLTGPNRGGKSSLMDNVVFAHWCAEVSSLAVAKSITITPGSRLITHSPGDGKQSFRNGGDGFSRFEREVARFSSILHILGKNDRPVAVFLDEVFSSTAEMEAADVSPAPIALLLAHQQRPMLLISSHNAALIDVLSKIPECKLQQMLWIDGKPGHVFAKGRSEGSYAAEVVREQGLDAETLRGLAEEVTAFDRQRFSRLLRDMQK